jgi:colanic acid/amylovoran biosynthesis glycosyltransferase
MSVRIAYFINQYPMVSHAFIRREILALERHGLNVLRISLRGWTGELVDPDDDQERALTRYVLKDGVASLVIALVRTLLAEPGRFFAAFALAVRMGWRAERPLPFHLIYLAEACRMLPWLKEFGASHIHAHFGTNSAEIVMLARALGGPPYSFTVHGPKEFDKPQFLGIGEKIRRAAFVVAITSYTRSQLYRWVEHAYWKKIKLVHCGLEPDFFAGAPVPPPESPRLVCLGRLVEQKGQLLLIEATALLAARGIFFELVLVGGGEMRPEIEALIVTRGLSERVQLTGSVSTERLREELLKARGLVLPSFAEGLPMVIMEAMALRRPVLTTYIAGIPELVRPGENGWLFPAGSVEDLAAAIEDFISRTPEELRIMGEAAYARVLDRHSADKEAAKLAELFKNSEA